MSNDELQKAIDDITRDNAMPVAPEANAAANEALANEMAGVAPSKGEGVALNPLADLGQAPAPNVPETPGMPPVGPVQAAGVPVEGAQGGEAQSVAPEAAEAPVAETVQETASVQGIEEADAKRGEEIAPVEALSEEQAENLVIGEPKVEKAEASGEDLEKIGKAAMKELYPLLEQVSLSAEEKFEICMEVAGEEPKAISGAFEAAKRIQDEKTKAEALLRIVKFKK